MKASPYLVASLALAALLPRAHAWTPKYAPLMTDWAQLVSTNQPLPEYPRPQMVRADWLNLNGIWQFQAGALADPVPTNQTLSTEILVPYPMESALSGHRQYHDRAWYRRTFTVPPAWNGQHVLLHLDAVDWESEVFINGQSVGVHQGGYDAFSYDITAYLNGPGPQELIVRIYDPTDNGGQPRGKQTLSPGGIMYTSTSGIWQTVWLEPVPPTSIATFKLVPDIDAQRLAVTVNLSGSTSGMTVYARARSGSNVVGSIAGAPGAALLLPVPNPNLWSPTNPFLYDLDLVVSNASAQIDAVSSYFGMRKISLATNNGFVKMLLNNQFVFQFGPLDQGFWPDGIYRAPTDDALKSDIEQEKTLGYNMLRKHIKVEPDRWYYWADKLGILVWQDMPSANSYTGNPQPIDATEFQTELTRMVQNHWNHPAIIMWVIFNESQGQHDTAQLVQTVQTLDPSRLVNQASGGSYVGAGDILDVHSYPDPAYPTSSSQACVCGEFGGVGLGITNHTWASGWGYVAATDGNDLASKFENFCYQLSDFVQNHGLNAAVYTEITDCEVELNGFLTYDRKVRKPDADRIRAAIATASAPFTLTTVVPTSQSAAQSWKYTTNTPASNWMTNSYSDSAWNTGLAGFGAGNPPNTSGLVRTPWNTSDIWLRRTFNPGTLTPQQLTNLFVVEYNDEDVEVYINGVLAGSATGYRTSYGLMNMTAAGRAAVVPSASNLLAVHCHQTGGGQYIDVGLSLRQATVVVPPRPLPPAPSGLRSATGALGISLGWNSCSNATSYKVKRSLVSGGPYTNLILTSPNNALSDASGDPGTTYYYVVSALNATGESADSAEISATTLPPPPPVLRAWFKADAITGLNNGAAVAVWSDQSGNGLDATQSAANQRPTYATGAIAGWPAVHFNAVNTNYLAFPRPVQDDFTILCVFRSNQGANTGTQFYQGAGLVSGEVPNVTDDFGVSLNANGKVLAGTGHPDTSVASASGFNDGQPHLLTFRRTRSTGTLALYVDGALQGTATAGVQSLTTPAQLVLGAQQTLINYLTGDIAEVKLYGSALSEADRLAEENSLSCKYGIGPGGAPNTPQNLAAQPGNRRASLNWQAVLGAQTYRVAWSTNSGGPYATIATGLTTTNYTHTSALMGLTNYYQVLAVSYCGLSAPASAAVLVPQLLLSASLSPGSISLSWPGWATDWTLHAATNLQPPVDWTLVPEIVTSNNGQFSVSLTATSGIRFFRLSNP